MGGRAAEWWEAYTDLRAHGTFPAEGPRFCQASWFLRASAVADAERGRIEDEQRRLKEATHGG